MASTDPVGSWPDEPSIYPYQALGSLPARRLLVLAPHPDDEVLGCGGAIAAALHAGAQVEVVVLSDGGLGGDPVQREAESRAAAQVLSAGAGGSLALHFWRLPDRSLATDLTLAARLAAHIGAGAAELLLLPSPHEIHPDHRGLCLAALRAVQAIAWSGELMCYEIGQPLQADCLLDLTPWLARKQQALRCFASQLAQQAYDEQLLGLNRYRAYTLGPQVTHAEAFQRIERQAWHRGLAGVLEAGQARLRARYPGV